jgi:hypothetical protein
MKTQLEWHPGPANGGVGTAGKNEAGVSQWYDGDRLLVVVEINTGEREIVCLDVIADEERFETRLAGTDELYSAFLPEDWSWWAKLDTENLPPVEVVART